MIQKLKNFLSSIKVWDIVEGLLSTYSFNSAHRDTITCVDVQPGNNSVFASTSLDCEALTWDIRQSKPAHGIKIFKII